MDNPTLCKRGQRVRKLIALFISTSIFINSISFAQMGGRPLVDDVYQSRINEYFFNKTDRDVLHPVKIFGSVQKPGLYHLPSKTSLTTLFSISGGVTNDADTEKIIIRRIDGSVIEKDLYKVVAKSDEISMQEGDIVYIPKQEGFISSPNAGSILVLTTVLSVILSGIIVSRGSH